MGYSLLHGLRQLAPYWTLHGGGSLIYHLNHRLPNDLDFFCEVSCWEESAAAFTAQTIIPPYFPDADGLRKRATKCLKEPHGFFKLHFEKITLSFLKAPIPTGTLVRVYPEGLLPVASLGDIIGLKVGSLGRRHAFIDYVDWVAILTQSGWSLPQIIEQAEKFRSVSRERDDFAYCFSRLAILPVEAEEKLTAQEKHLLKKASERALQLLKT